MSKKQIVRKTMRQEKGLSLIEIALAMAILGLIMTPLLRLYNIERKQEEINATRGDFFTIEAALANYVNTNDRYPMPASLTDVEEDATYGKAFDPLGGFDPVATTPTGLMPGACPGALATQGTCLITQDENGVAIPANEQLLIGMVPFADLLITEEDAYDTWGQRILYVVHTRQTQANGSTYAGGIYERSLPNEGVKFTALNTFTQDPVVNDLGGNELIVDGGVTGSYTNFDALLVSTGPSGRGGFNAGGFVVDTCVELGNPEHEDENCDFTDSLFMIDANERADPRTEIGGGTVNNLASSRLANGTRNTNAGPRFYDDLTHEIQEISADVWNNNFTDTEYVVTSANRLGIGTQNPQGVVHVAGDLLADDDPSTVAAEGRVVAERISDLAGADIMSPELLGGAVPEMNCYEFPSALGNRVRVVTGVGNGRKTCAQAGNGTNGVLSGDDPFNLGRDVSGTFTPIATPRDCETFLAPLPANIGARMRGIDASGDPICSTFVIP